MASIKSRNEPTKAEIDFEGYNWNTARDTFKTRHKDGDLLRSFLKSTTNGISVKETCSKLQKESDSKYHKSLGGILDKIDQLMQVGDLAIKSAPESVGLAWMGIRMCLHGVQGDFATFQLFSGACEDIIGIMISCRVYGKMYGSQEGPEDFQELHSRVIGHIPGIYTDILDFSYAIRKYMDKNILIRVGKNILKDVKSGFQSMIDGIKAHEKLMRDFANIATDRWLVHYQKEGLKGQDEMRADVLFMKEALDANLKANEAFVRHIESLEEERKDMRKKSPEEKAKEEFEENKRILNPADDQSDILRDNLENRREPGTCRWIFDLDEYKEWHNSTGSSMIWVTGAAGYGKSILMSTVVETLQAESLQNPKVFVQYFFCKTGNDTTQTTIRILQTVLFHLYAGSESSTTLLEKANEILRPILGKKGSDQTTSSKKTINFESTFSTLLQALDRDVYLVIDAVDECYDREEKHLLQSLQKVVDTAGNHFKVIICSRPEPDIGNELQNTPTIKCEGRNEDDIRKNVTAEMNRFPGWTASEKARACDEIVKKAGGQFKYVPIALDFLRKPLVRPYDRAVKGLPNGLIGSYITSWDNTDSDYLDLLKTALTWTILAEGTITVPEVMDAYSRTYSMEAGIEEDQEYAEDQHGSPDLHDKQVRTAGGNFLEVSNSRNISLRHATVKDFFLHQQKDESRTSQDSSQKVAPNGIVKDTKSNADPVSKWLVSEKEGHLAIAKTLVQNLISPAFQRQHLMCFDLDDPDTNDVDPEKTFKDQSNTQVSKNSAEVPSPEPSALTIDVANGFTEDAGLKGDLEASEEQIAEKDIEHGDKYKDADEDGAGVDTGGDFVDDEHLGTKENGLPQEEADKASEDDEEYDQYTDDTEDDFSDDEQYIQDYDNDELWNNTKSNFHQRYRYELTHWQYHLREAEGLWSKEDIETNEDWNEILEGLNTFMCKSPVAFRVWSQLMGRDFSSALYTGNFNNAYSPLQVAAAFRLTSLSQMLINQNHKVDERTELMTWEGWHPTPLEIAVDEAVDETKDAVSKTVRLLLENKADPNLSYDGPTAFHWAVQSKPSREYIQLFLDHGAKMDVVDDWGYNVMHRFAITGTDPDHLQLLLEAGGNINCLNSDGETALHVLVDRENLPIDLLESFLKAGAEVNIDDNKSKMPLFVLANGGNLKAVQLLVEHGADIHDKDDRGLAAIHAAALSGSMEVVKLLIEKGVAANLTDNKGRTPLYFACQGGKEDTARYLIELLKDLPEDEFNRADSLGRTPFRKAAARGNTTLMRLLLAKIDAAKAVNAVDSKTGQTAVHTAAYNGEKAALEILLENGGSLTLLDKQGQTALQLCSNAWAETDSDANEDVLMFLIDQDKEAAMNYIELHFIAAMKGSVRLMNRLLEIGADPNSRDKHGWTLLVAAQQSHQDAIVELLSTQTTVMRMRPTKWVSGFKNIRISNNGLQIEDVAKYWFRTSIVSNHPIPAGITKYYYEIEVLQIKVAPSDPDEVPGIAVIGFLKMPTTLAKVLPGLRGYAWNSDDGFIRSVRFNNIESLYGGGPWKAGDVIGCAVDFSKKVIFYTRNGKRMNTAFTDVSGRLYPALGTGGSVILRTNFGGNTENPWKWKGWEEWQQGV